MSLAETCASESERRKHFQPLFHSQHNQVVQMACSSAQISCMDKHVSVQSHMRLGLCKQHHGQQNNRMTLPTVYHGEIPTRCPILSMVMRQSLPIWGDHKPVAARQCCADGIAEPVRRP